jgi:hypothetical protein
MVNLTCLWYYRHPSESNTNSATLGYYWQSRRRRKSITKIRDEVKNIIYRLSVWHFSYLAYLLLSSNGPRSSFASFISVMNKKILIIIVITLDRSTHTAKPSPWMQGPRRELKPTTTSLTSLREGLKPTHRYSKEARHPLLDP